MNVIFLDFDGVLVTFHRSSKDDIIKRIKILKEICKDTNSRIVISSTHKDSINKDTLTSNVHWINEIIVLFKKNNIELIDITDTCERKYYSSSFIWKDDEIRKYLFNHPKISHYCIIDDDIPRNEHSDLFKSRKHLVSPEMYSKRIEKEGLLKEHLEDVKEKLKLSNEIQKYALKRISK